MDSSYDAIVVGTRCAGSPLAMLLARKGYRVLGVDRATFPSDTVSTHVIHPVGVSALSRWGLLDRLTATGCPPIDTYSFDFGPLTIAGRPGTDAFPVAYCPRRTVLDRILVDAAAEAGVELRQGFTVEDLAMEGDRVVGVVGHDKEGARVEARAHVVVGADGRHSRVAEKVKPAQYNEKPPILANYYAYFSGLPTGGRFEIFIRERRGFAAVQTHDDLTLVVVGWPYAEFEQNRGEIERHFVAAIDLVPSFAERFHRAKRESRFIGATVPGYFRKPYGPGWALVGDAAYNKEPITAQGISDAFRDVELCASALEEAFSGERSFDEAMADYQRERDQHVLPMYELTCQIASLEPPPAEGQRILGAIARNQRAMDDFVRMNAGGLCPSKFYTRENIGAILAAAG